jgi:MFS family permease
MSEQMPFYIFTVYVLTYGKHLGFGKDFLTNAVMGAAALSLISVPLFGHLSDRFGRRRVYVAGAILTGLWAIPYFTLLDTQDPTLVVIAIVLSLIPHDMQYGPQAALIAESFPTRLRYSGAGIGYQLASVIAGGPSLLVAAWLFHEFGSSLPIAAYIMAGSLITVIAVGLLSADRRREVEREFEGDLEAGVTAAARGAPERLASEVRESIPSGGR